jgi:hypothetical protein
MRRHLVWVLGLAGAVAAAGVASAVQTEHVSGTVSPSKLPKTKRAPVALTFSTGPHTAVGEPLSPATRVQIFVDDEVAVFNRGLATCSVSQINGRSTSAAKAACGGAQVGAGSASANVGGLNVPVTVTAFNGANKTLLLHFAASIGSPVVLVGRLKSASGDYGIRLDVSVPPLASGVAILTGLRTKLRKTYTFRGKRRSFLSAKCGDANRKLNFKGTFNYENGSSLTTTDTQACTVRR